MVITPFLQQSPVLAILFSFLIGVSVGSFLNVVIHRLPLMLERRWRQDSLAFLDQTDETDKTRFNLAVPRSRCPHCGHQITSLENIPILSFLWLRGKCSSCKERISCRYPLVELFCGVLTAFSTYHFAFTAEAFWAVTLLWSLMVLAVIDYDHQLLPDIITLPLLWIGMLLSLTQDFTTPSDAIIGAVTGYLVLWSVYHIFRIVTGKHGMGYGDFKLLAALGAWFGWQAIPVILLLAASTGAIIGIAMIAVGKRDKQSTIPFGPYLAAAGWITLIFQQEIMHYYYH